METFTFYGTKELYIWILNAVTANAEIINCKIKWIKDNNVNNHGWTEITISPKDLFWTGITVGQRMKK